MNESPQGTNFRERAQYSITSAARYLGLPQSTLRSWALGRDFPTRNGRQHSPALFPLADLEGKRLSFLNLVEAHVLVALRGFHRISMANIRSAIDYAEAELHLDRLLLDPSLEAAGGELFLQRMDQLINLSRSGQLAIKRLLADHLERIERDSMGRPCRLFPFTASQRAARVVVIDPRISYGRPVIESRGISTGILVDRLDAGETIEALMRDYELKRQEVEEGLLYETLAA